MYKKKFYLKNVIEDDYTRESLHDLFCLFSANKKELYLVGGCVRDLLLNKKPSDYDLCTNLKPDQVKELLSSADTYPFPRYKCIDTGIKHGTITIHDKWRDRFFEITTYRIDGKYEDGRHPDQVTFTPSLEEDLKRRDFTVNSFAYDFLNDDVLCLEEDFLYDLDIGIIRSVGDPAKRYEEDALRMLRAIRFSAQLGFSIEKYTYIALSMCAPLIKKISKERIRDELTKILMSDNPQMLEFISETGIEAQLGWNLISNMLNCEHQNPWHYTDVFHHTMDVIKRVPKTFELRWSAFFHDCGKPDVKELKKDSVDHYRYIGHPEKSAALAEYYMDELKFSNEQKETINKFVLYHDYPFATCSNKKFKQKLVTIGEEKFKDFIKLIEADSLAHKISVSTSFAIYELNEIKRRYIKLMKNPEPLRIKDLSINGDDLLSLGLAGKDIGDALIDSLDYILSNPDKNSRENLVSYLKKKGYKLNQK